MATILVCNVDELVVEALKAKAHGRSMEAEVRAVLSEAADPGDLTGEALVAFLTSGPKVTEDFVLDKPDDPPSA